MGDDSETLIALEMALEVPLTPELREALGKLAAALAHDMNNVLAAIASYANLLYEDPRHESARGDLGNIIEQTNRGATLTRALLELSKRGQYRRDAVTRNGMRPLKKPSMPVETGTILLVDDEAAVRDTSKRLLERMGLCVVTAANGVQALEQFAKYRDVIQLVVLDMGMPVMGGAECFRKLRGESNVPVLIATGYADDQQAARLVKAGASIIEKPFSAAMFRKEVSRILGRTDSIPRTGT